ncbi:Ribokinase-like protein [Haematococcus lacustris]
MAAMLPQRATGFVAQEAHPAFPRVHRTSRRQHRSCIKHAAAQQVHTSAPPRIFADFPALPSRMVAAEARSATPHSGGKARWDILGLAQAMVDFTASVPEALLSEAPFSVAKGARRVITLQERHKIMQELDTHGCESQVSPGGSLANTLVAISRLSAAHKAPMQTAIAGCVGSDTLGSYFNAQLKQAGVQVLVDPDNTSHTGTVMVLTTPDAQRSFLSFFDSGKLYMTQSIANAIIASSMVVIEGYMLELPGAHCWLPEVISLARAHGVQVALTAGDPGVVQRHRIALQSLLDAGVVDLLFCNREEACELLGGQTLEDARCAGASAAVALGRQAEVVVVTDGPRGAFICSRGVVHEVPPHWTPHGPVDVCGAGDAYAAGILYAHLQGYDLPTAGNFAAKVAAAVIGRHGAQLAEEDADQLVAGLPDHVPLPLYWSAAKWEHGVSAM